MALSILAIFERVMTAVGGNGVDERGVILGLGNDRIVMHDIVGRFRNSGGAVRNLVTDARSINTYVDYRFGLRAES